MFNLNALVQPLPAPHARAHEQVHQKKLEVGNALVFHRTYGYTSNSRQTHQSDLGCGMT
jgi:hypothetical protein